MKKKVLFLLADSAVEPCGGLGERYRHLFPLLKDSFECAVFCTGKGGTFLDIPVMGLDDIGVPYKGGQALQAIMPGYINEFIDQTFIPDIVVSTDHMMIYPGFTIARHRKAKFVIDFNLALFSFQKQYNQEELIPEFKVYSDYINESEKFGIISAHSVVLCSNYYKKELPISPKKEAEVVPNGIDLSLWDASPANYSFPGNYKHNLLYIGRLNSQKGVELLFDLNLPPDTALHFVGPEQGSNRFKEMLEAVEKKPNFFYLGKIFGNEKISLIKSADAVLFPTLHEPFGIVFLEALAAKTPLITTMVGEMETALTESDCIKCDKSTSSIRESIDRLLSMGEKEKSQLIDNGYNVAKSYTWKKAAKKFQYILNNL